MRRPIALLFVMAMLAVMVAAIPVAATEGVDEGPKKVWLCHFDGHVAPMVDGEYGDDRTPDDPGFWTVGATGEYLTRDYVVKYNPQSYDGIPAGLNPGQVGLCEGNYGEFILVSVNAIGTEEDVKGHHPQLISLNVPGTTAPYIYPDGWKG